MKHSKQFLTFSLASLIFLGAGCAQQTIRLQTTKLPEDMKSIPQIQGIPDGWNRVAATVGTSTVYVAFPGKITPQQGSMTQEIFESDLGTAVKDPGEKSVPTQTLRVYVLNDKDQRIKNCAFSENGWNNGNAPTIDKNLTFGSVPTKFCHTSESDAGLGNRYYTQSFATKLGDQYLVLEFMVHSVVCENFEKPEEQCVAYDEKRDTEIFAQVLSQLKVQ